MPSQVAQVHGDGLVHAVAGQAQRRGGDDAAERDDGHFRGAAADIHDHRARRLGDGQVGAHGRGHGLLDEVRLTSAGLNGSLEHRALLHRGCAARDADDDAGLGLPGILARRRFADERRDHGLGHVVVGHYAVVQGMLGRERLGRMVDHVLGFVAHCEHAMGRLLDGDNRGSLTTMPSPGMATSVFAVPRSMAISVDIWPVRPENMSKKDIQETP